MVLRLQYSSDLHLEFKPVNVIPKLLKPVGADVLILAGDISAISDPKDYDKFVTLITYYSKKYKYLIHVAGNHEMYCTEKPVKREHCMDEVHKKFKALMKTIPNYIYLNNDIVTLTINNKPYMFAGSTLWTKVNPEDREYVQRSMNDYSNIYIADKDNKITKYTVEEMQKLHAKCVAFFKRAIKKSIDLNLPLIIITHHKPVLEGASSNRLNQAYECDMSKVFTSKNIKLAIHGHTHVNYDKIINGIRYVANCKGYPSQHCGFKEDVYIDI